MEHAVLVIFLSVAVFHIWFVYRKFVRPTGQSIPRTRDQVIRRYVSADEPTKMVFWLSTTAVLLLAALLQLRIS